MDAPAAQSPGNQVQKPDRSISRIEGNRLPDIRQRQAETQCKRKPAGGQGPGVPECIQELRRAQHGARFYLHVQKAGTDRYRWKKRRGKVHFSGFTEDRKSTRLNSSHVRISYAVF